MNLHFITSVSKSYWEYVGNYCINTWKLPGEVTVYIDQQEGELGWLEEIKFKKRLQYIPPLNVAEYLDEKTKVRKFWGKSCAQIHALRNRADNTRIIWLDADIEQIKPIRYEMFAFDFEQPVAIMKSNDKVADCYETGLVIFNQQNEKLTLFANQYEKFWKNEEDLLSLLRPYDAMVLGALAEKRSFYNLVSSPCDNKYALQNTRYRPYFTHWINKENKVILADKIKNGKV